ncbi:MAG: hypothetical protein FWC39_11265 [Bacteroidetes bacterium]|nr:hypothetical protein [Bacteroidota bacterium]
MATAIAAHQFNVFVPSMDLKTFDKLTKAFEWVATPVRAKTVEKKMSMEEMRALVEKTDKMNNPQGLKITSAEIDAIIEECRNGK